MRHWIFIPVVFLASCSPAIAPQAGITADESLAGVEDLTVVAPAGIYKLDRLHTYLTWTIPHNTLSNYMARLTRFDATITWEPGDLAASSVEISIDPTSVVTHHPGDYGTTHAVRPFSSWDEEISQSSRFLNAKEFPTITFKSNRVELTGERTGRVTGDLTFRGITRPVTLDVTLNGALASHPFRRVPALGFSARGQIKPSDFGMTLISSLSDTVSIAFDGEFQRQAETPPPAT